MCNNGSVSLTSDLSVFNFGASRELYSKWLDASNKVLFSSELLQTRSYSTWSFSTFFSFFSTNLNPFMISGGLIFVVAPNRESISTIVGSLELINNNGVSVGFMVMDFDTLMDVEFKGINENHVGLNHNNMVSSKVRDLNILDIDLESKFHKFLD
ncbi:hypothetical protein SLA2020_341460 [Shorea laevis]